MNSQMKNMEKFDQYLEEVLDDKQRQDFINELENDASLREEFFRHQVVVDGIKLHGRTKLLGNIKSWDNEIKSINIESDGNKSTGRFRWYYAAAAVVVIFVSVFVLFSTLNTGHDSIVAAHYQPYIYISDIQRGAPTAENTADKIYLLYDQGNFEQTIELIDEVPAAERTDLMNFIFGNALQASGEYQKAIPIFEDIVDSNSVYSFGSKWYLALCYLSVDDFDKATVLLYQLKDSNSSFAPKAEKLIQDLD